MVFRCISLCLCFTNVPFCVCLFPTWLHVGPASDERSREVEFQAGEGEQQLHFFPPDFGPVDYAAGMILMKAGALMSPGWVMMLENLDKGWVGLGL